MKVAQENARASHDWFYFFLLLDDKVVRVNYGLVCFISLCLRVFVFLNASRNAFPRSISVNARAKLTSNCASNIMEKKSH